MSGPWVRRHDAAKDPGTPRALKFFRYWCYIAQLLLRFYGVYLVASRSEAGSSDQHARSKNR